MCFLNLIKLEMKSSPGLAHSLYYGPLILFVRPWWLPGLEKENVAGFPGRALLSVSRDISSSSMLEWEEEEEEAFSAAFLGKRIGLLMNKGKHILNSIISNAFSH